MASHGSERATKAGDTLMDAYVQCINMAGSDQAALYNEAFVNAYRSAGPSAQPTQGERNLFARLTGERK